MKKLIALTFICAAGIISCGKKIMPESDANNPSKPVNDRSGKPATQIENTNTGTNSNAAPSFNNMQTTGPQPDAGAKTGTMDKAKTIYVSKCGGCHTLKNPSDYTQEQTLNFLRTEIPKAKLSSKESDAVTAYMLENAKK